MSAIRVPNEALFDKLISLGADLNAKTDDGQTILQNASIWACGKDGGNIIKKLIGLGIDLNSRSGENNSTPLMFMVQMYNCDSRNIELLIKNGTRVNEKDRNGNTALMLATTESKNENMQRLLSNGANINEVNNFGETALMIAARFDRTGDTIKMLLDEGANAKIKSRDNKTAFNYAEKNSNIKNSMIYWRLNDLQY